MTESHPPGTVAPHSLSLRPFRHSYSLPLASNSSAHSPFTSSSSFFGNLPSSAGGGGGGYTSEYVPRHAPIPESWTMTNPIPPSSPPQDSQGQDDVSYPARSLLAPSLWRSSAATVVSSYFPTEVDSDHHHPTSSSYQLDSGSHQDTEGRMLGDDLDLNLTLTSDQPHSVDDSEMTDTERQLIQAANKIFYSSLPSSTSKHHSPPTRPHSHSLSQTQTHTRIPSYRPPQGISPLRIHRLAKEPSSLPSPESPESSFDTPLSERQRRRRAAIALVEVKAKQAMDENPDEGPITPTPVRFRGVPLVRSGSGSGFSLLDKDEDDEKDAVGEEITEDKERERALWSPELEDMGMDVDQDERGEEDDVSIELGKGRIERQKSAAPADEEAGPIPSSPPPGLTPLKEITHSQINTSSPNEQASSNHSKFQADAEVKEEDSSDEEDYRSSPYRPLSIALRRGPSRARGLTQTLARAAYHPYATRLRHSSPPSSVTGTRRGAKEDTEDAEQDIDIAGVGASGNGSGTWAGKGEMKAEEFRVYLNGPRSHRDPRFDLKVFHWAVSGCPGMSWVKGGNGLEIKDVTLFYKNVLHKEAREKKEQQGKIATKHDLPGKSSFERQLSGYGFKRTTIGRSMIIERPDLRKDNHALFRKVQQVWLEIEGGVLVPRSKPDKLVYSAGFLRKQVKDLESQLEDKEVQMGEVVRLVRVLLDSCPVDPVLLEGTLRKLGTGLPAGIITALQLAISKAAHLTADTKDPHNIPVAMSMPVSNSSKPSPSLAVVHPINTPLKGTIGRAPLSESRSENLDLHPTPLNSIKDVFFDPKPAKTEDKTKTRGTTKTRTAGKVKRGSTSMKRDENKVDPGTTAKDVKIGKKNSIRGTQAQEN